jgi:hypothetical protein
MKTQASPEIEGPKLALPHPDNMEPDLAPDQTRDSGSQLKDDVPIDPMLQNPHAPTRPTCTGDMPKPPATTTPSRDTACSDGIQSLETQPTIAEPLPANITKREVPERFRCGICADKPFVWSRQLKTHVLRKHPDGKRVYACNNPVCKQSFDFDVELM